METGEMTWVGLLFAVLIDLWLSKRERSFASLQKRKLIERHINVHIEVTEKIQPSMGKFEVFCAEKQE